MRLLKIAKSHVDVVDKQKEMLGVDEAEWLHDEHFSQLLLKSDCSDRLKLVIENKLVAEQDVALITMIGVEAIAQASQYQQLLNHSDISVLHFCEDKHSITLVIEPEAIDKAAVVLHDNTIITSGTVVEDVKQVHLG